MEKVSRFVTRGLLIISLFLVFTETAFCQVSESENKLQITFSMGPSTNGPSGISFLKENGFRDYTTVGFFGTTTYPKSSGGVNVNFTFGYQLSKNRNTGFIYSTVGGKLQGESPQASLIIKYSTTQLGMYYEFTTNNGHFSIQFSPAFSFQKLEIDEWNRSSHNNTKGRLTIKPALGINLDLNLTQRWSIYVNTWLQPSHIVVTEKTLKNDMLALRYFSSGLKFYFYKRRLS